MVIVFPVALGVALAIIMALSVVVLVLAKRSPNRTPEGDGDSRSITLNSNHASIQYLPCIENAKMLANINELRYIISQLHIDYLRKVHGSNTDVDKIDADQIFPLTAERAKAIESAEGHY